MNSVSLRDSLAILEAGATPCTNLSSSFSHRKCRESSAAMAAKTVFIDRSVTIGSYITRHRGTGLPAAFHSCAKRKNTRHGKTTNPACIVPNSETVSVRPRVTLNKCCVSRFTSPFQFCEADEATDRVAEGTQTQQLYSQGLLHSTKSTRVGKPIKHREHHRESPEIDKGNAVPLPARASISFGHVTRSQATGDVFITHPATHLNNFCAQSGFRELPPLRQDGSKDRRWLYSKSYLLRRNRIKQHLPGWEGKRQAIC